MKELPAVWKSNVVWISLSFIISLLAARNLLSWHSPTNWQDLSEAAQGVLSGKPHWRAYQNRLLGPAIVAGINLIFDNHVKSLKIFSVVGLCLHSVILFVLLRSIGISKRESLLYCSFWLLCFLALQHYWFYTWDIIDVIIFTIISFCIVFERYTKWIMVLYPLALLNRESALFIPVALILFELSKSSSVSFLKNVLQSRVPIAIYLTSLIVGVIYTKIIRDWLFLETNRGDPDLKHQVLGNHIQLFGNLRDLFWSNWSNINVSYNSIIWIVILWSLYSIIRNSDVGLRAGHLLLVAIFANITIFGIINETRMLFPLVSLTMFLLLKERILESSRRP